MKSKYVYIKQKYNTNAFNSASNKLTKTNCTSTKNVFILIFIVNSVSPRFKLRSILMNSSTPKANTPKNFPAARRVARH